jgi:hypothetical protein
MSKILRKTAKVFASSQAGSPSNQIAVFGSLAAGSPSFSGDVAAIQSAAWLTGWTGAVEAVSGGTTQPTLEDDNAINYVVTSQIAYLLQQGVAEWDSATTYFTNSVVQYNGDFWFSLTDNNAGAEPDTSPSAWSSYSQNLKAKGIAKAWIIFNGVSGAIIDSYNVTSLTKNSTGDYTVNIASAFAYASVCVVGTSSGLVRPVSTSTTQVRVTTAGVTGGGTFVNTDYSYNSLLMFTS